MSTFTQGAVLVVAIAGVAFVLAVGAVLARVGLGPDRDLEGRWDPRTEWSFRAKARHDREALAVAVAVLLMLALLAAITPGQVPS